MDLFDLKAVAKGIATANKLSASAVISAIKLLEEGNTLPFIARYRKEATQGLDEVALRAIEDELARARTLASRKKSILAAIEEQGALTDELKKQIIACNDKAILEDLYLPYKKKRRTKATIAREAGLGPLAELLLKQERTGKTKKAILSPFVDAKKGIKTTAAAFEGAGHIVAETWTEDVDLRTWLFAEIRSGKVTSKVKRGKKELGKKFENYYDFSESIKRIASHRFLAIRRGADEGFLNPGITVDDEYFLRQLKRRLVTNRDFEFFHDLLSLVEAAWKTHLLPAASQSVMASLKEKAEAEAINVFAKNIRELLLAPPAGKQVTIGLDPGFRSGCKVAAVDETGKFLDNTVIYPTAPKNDVAGASKVLLGLIKKYGVKMIAIGNGTASRETDAFVAKLIKKEKLDVTKVVVSESGASIYSASQVAIDEYPDLDITVRGAISIAHRLQDPLAELVKIDAKSIGVGQYQHDVNQTELKRSLDREVESCVNLVGVELNTASRHLLAYVSGIGPKTAERIVAHRDANGMFDSKQQLLEVPKLGAKVFQQAAGFLRIAGGQDPLDNSAVHPESHAMVKKMAGKLDLKVERLLGNTAAIAKLKAADFVDDKFGEPTVTDILAELVKPGRDPRSQFKAVKFDDSVNEVSDLREGMRLQGQVTNVTNFGAFVDIGVHQDGLVHVSQLADHFVSDPAEIVSVNDIVSVRVVSIDENGKRIGLSMKTQ